MDMKDTHEKVRRFMIAFNRIDALYVDSMRTFGVKGNLFVLFYAIADGKAYSQRQICDDWHLPRTTLNTIVRECVKDGLVELLPRGNKEKDIHLTPKGRKIADEVFGPIFAAESRVMEPFLAAGALEMMEKMADSFEAVFANLKPHKR